MRKRIMRNNPDDLDELLQRDREDEMHDLEEFTVEDIAFLQEMREMAEEYR